MVVVVILDGDSDGRGCERGDGLRAGVTLVILVAVA